MKRQRSSESMASISPSSSASDDQNQGNNPRDDDGCSLEESCQVLEKKTRLSIDQVRALERNFEVENKLDLERKVKLAREVGLQPRQVAIWFQNRRARYKTKQLEKDYTCLKANFDGLTTEFELLQHHNESLLQEIRELKSKLNESSYKQGEMEEQIKLQPTNDLVMDTKDGSLDMGSTSIFNEVNDNNDNNNQNNNVPCKNLTFHYLENYVSRDEQGVYLHHPFSKIEEHNFFDEELIFVGDQTPAYLESWNEFEYDKRVLKIMK